MLSKRLLFWLVGLILWGLLRGLLPLLPVPKPLLPIVWALVLVAGIALLIWLALEVGKAVQFRWAAIFGLLALGSRMMLIFLPIPKSMIGQIALGTFADTLTLASALLLGSAISPLIR
ncbi:MAG: hypothetical protein RMK94_17565, partial [Armatimonadota bacterium]|nr:hypothetical protein [Armatimonadota bacterium]